MVKGKTPEGKHSDFERIRMILHNPETTLEDIIPIIRRNINPDIFKEIASIPRWTKEYQVKLELCLNPRTPTSISIRFLKFLYRSDLLKVIQNVNIPGLIRHTATELMSTRLRALTLGERIAMARVAPNALVKILLYDPDLKVLEAALNNPNLLERDLYPFIHHRKTRPEQLALIAKTNRWNKKYSIKYAMIKNPRNPQDISLQILSSLMTQDLMDIIQDRNIPKRIRERAKVVFKSKLVLLPQREKIMIAEVANAQTLDILCEHTNEAMVMAMLKNPNITIRHLSVLLKNATSKGVAEKIKSHILVQDPQNFQLLMKKVGEDNLS